MHVGMLTGLICRQTPLLFFYTVVLSCLEDIASAQPLAFIIILTLIAQCFLSLGDLGGGWRCGVDVPFVPERAMHT